MKMIRKLSMSPRADVSSKKKIHSGYLYKQGTMFNKKFQKRFFILFEGRFLNYYPSETAQSDLRGQINLDEVVALKQSDHKIDDVNIYQHTFEITTKDRTYVLSAADPQSMNRWLDYIRSCVFGNVIHRGWLTKQGEVVKSWKRRWFVLTDTKLLRYFEDEQQTKFKGAINVQKISSIKEGHSVEPYWNFMIHLQTPDRLFLLNADSEAKRQEWLTMLNEGKKAINYDAAANLFVDIMQEHNITQSVNCIVNERVKYILRLYEKWCQGNEQFEEKQLLKTLSPGNETETTGFVCATYIFFGYTCTHEFMLSNVQKKEGTNQTKGIWEIINNDLKDYNNVQLLNDFNFILNEFGNKRNTFLDLYHYILGKDKEAPSVSPDKSLILMRNIHDKVFYAKYDEQRKLLYNDSDDVKEINAQCLLDRIYFYIMYSYNTVILSPVEWSRIQHYDETDKMCTAKEMLNEKKNWMQKVKKIYRINDRAHKFMIDVRSQSKEENKTDDEVENEEKKEDVEELFVEPKEYNRMDVTFKDEANGYFEFGSAEFLYWDSTKESEWFIPKKFENLKEEILQNKSCPISIQQFDDLYQSATNISESSKTSQYLSYEGLEDTADDISLDTQHLVDRFGIYEFTPIKLNHICSILLYCNYYQLQQVLLSTYAPNVGENESIQAWKERHAEFANWAKYLRESVEIFGKRITEKDIFYYAINSDQIEFGKSLKVCFNVPMSMTRNLFVAQSYFEFDEEKIGMLLSLTKQSNATAMYMDVGWCSDFPQEQEVLVLSAYPHQARIGSMVHISHKNEEMLFNNYQYYMSAIDDLDRLVQGQNSSDFIDRKSKNALEKMIKHRFGETDDEKHDDDDDHVKQPLKEVRISAAFGASELSPSFSINITSPNNDMKELKALNDANDEKNESKQSLDSPKVKAKVRPKGKAKETNVKSPRSSAKVTKDIVFQLKAKRKEKLPEYIRIMFDEYCVGVQSVNIDYAKMVSVKGGYRKWKDIFMTNNDNLIKMQIFVRLFPNLQQMDIHYVPQAFTKQTVKYLVAFLKSEHVKGRDLRINIFRPDIVQNFDDDNKGANIEDFSLQNALDKYLCKKSKTGNDFNWVCRLKEKEIDTDIPCIQIMRHTFQDSPAFLNEQQMDTLVDLLRKELTEKQPQMAKNWYLSRLYHAKTDGFDCNVFHKLCDGIGHTVSIVQSSNDCVFAAYASQKWGKTDKWVPDKYAFLIPLQSKDASKARIINIKAEHESFGIYLQSKGGPGFGKGDIKILNNADKSTRNTCNSNSFSFEIKPNELVGGNGGYFKVKDYEVFQAAFY